MFTPDHCLQICAKQTHKATEHGCIWVNLTGYASSSFGVQSLKKMVVQWNLWEDGWLLVSQLVASVA